MITYDAAAKRFIPGARTAPAMIPGRRRAAGLNAAMPELVNLLGQPDTTASQYPCWLVRYRTDGPILSVYCLSPLPALESGRRFRFSVGAQRGDAGLALMLAGDIMAALTGGTRGRPAERNGR